MARVARSHMKRPRPEKQGRLPRSDLYIVYSMSNSAYQQWQADLLDFSVHEVGQPGVIVRLCSLEGGARDSQVRPSGRGYTFVTPSFAELGHTSLQRLVLWSKRLLKHRVHGRFHFYCLNKALALKSFLESHPDLDAEAKLLLLDPDMVFCKPWAPPPSMVRRGVVTGQYWWGYDPSWCRRNAGHSDEALCPKGDSAIMFPFCITVGDMRAIVASYARFSAEIYHRARDWKSEMYGLVMAMSAARLECHTIAALGTCNNWPEGLPDDSAAPISHYTQVMHDRDGRELWDKRKYTAHTMATPWHRPPDPGRASSVTDHRSLQMLHRFIDWQDEQANPAPSGEEQE
jgi:hypothetical protein